jgi:hypothetical protein
VDAYNVTASLGYTFRFKQSRTLRLDLRVRNLLNDQGPLYAVSSVLRPKKGDLTSPARETVANIFSYKEPTTVDFTATLRF